MRVRKRALENFAATAAEYTSLRHPLALSLQFCVNEVYPAMSFCFSTGKPLAHTPSNSASARWNPMQMISRAGERALLQLGNAPTLFAGCGPSNRTGILCFGPVLQRHLSAARLHLFHFGRHCGRDLGCPAALCLTTHGWRASH
eukprot:3883314-Pyramimonas_sp.AAC.1